MTSRTEAEAAAEAAHRRSVYSRRAAMVLTIVVVTVLFVALPMRSYLRQQGDLDAARSELRRIEQDNDRLDARKQDLSSPDEVARIARRDYGLVHVGDESYSVLPPSTAGIVLPRAWPFDQIQSAVRAASGG
ncbi:MAG: septum formation initiator family protein [Actinobacteria bacterium]|nr:septum formation initiator family protein [Actinomycetota bacterium]